MILITLPVTNTSTTCIDKIFANLRHFNYKVNITDPLISDHYEQIMVINHFNIQTPPMLKRTRKTLKFFSILCFIIWENYQLNSSSNQFGFTRDAVIKVVTEIVEGLENSKNVNLLLSDLSILYTIYGNDFDSFLRLKNLSLLMIHPW